MYSEEEYLMLSGLQHYVFCRRQWALIHIEQQWEENYRTVDGRIFHKNAHDGSFREKRGNVIITRAMAVSSAIMGISGECDVVEFHKDNNGAWIPDLDGYYSVIPVEYKRGKPKETNCDDMQLCAQALCLEEMLGCEIAYAFIYYGETRRRHVVELSRELRDRTIAAINEMHQLYNRQYTPKVKRTKACNACSLKDLCLPVLYKKQSAREYLSERLKDGDI